MSPNPTDSSSDSDISSGERTTEKLQVPIKKKVRKKRLQRQNAMHEEMQPLTGSQDGNVSAESSGKASSEEVQSTKQKNTYDSSTDPFLGTPYLFDNIALRIVQDMFCLIILLLLLPVIMLVSIFNKCFKCLPEKVNQGGEELEVRDMGYVRVAASSSQNSGGTDSDHNCDAQDPSSQLVDGTSSGCNNGRSVP
ncbi:hypothetical protein EDL79_04145 [Ehrlichia ruminantium]|uniref:Uncharacterized protein n=1 Tax=Ehrlichia ruminantium TaxID=779 RepID=A0AAE6QBH0_EHRRU|nr:hypothetical protein [Ehrlichia ruminantium]QGR02804.1 hypothetical protein EDL81_04125 [Ehrlichia ruminantium]QGR03728.1 hypothetical protein EDL80_04135 [Ehrlichia ruminantium]QGR04655.1 hypothetical protein EDL79_04145 [Ehrlichia ruminantium]